jgi:hypothetical protein
MCAAVFIGSDPPQLPPPPHLGSDTRALLVSQDRGRLFVTPWAEIYSPRLTMPTLQRSWFRQPPPPPHYGSTYADFKKLQTKKC